MTLTCKPCKKEFKTSQGYGNHIKSLAHKLNPLHEISNNNLLSNNNHIPKQIQFNNEQENFMDIYSTSNENECSNSDSLHNSLSNERITTDDEELKKLISEIPNELKIPNNAFIDFMNVVDKYNISNKAGDAFLKVFKKYSSLDQNLLPKSTSAGRHYLRSINIFTLQFKKDLVSTYNNTNYYFENRSILLAIQELLQNDDLMQQCEFNYKEQWKVDENNQRVQCYAEIYNAN
ncbi:5686_t:CDS:2, partial [Gigaspora rosea]